MVKIYVRFFFRILPVFIIVLCFGGDKIFAGYQIPEEDSSYSEEKIINPNPCLSSKSGISCHLLMEDENGSKKKVSDTVSVRPGDRYRISVDSVEPVYVYAISIDSVGKWAILFPNRCDNGDFPENIMPGKMSMTFPFRFWYTVDTPKGNETVIVWATSQRSSVLEKIVSEQGDVCHPDEIRVPDHKIEGGPSKLGGVSSDSITQVSHLKDSDIRILEHIQRQNLPIIKARKIFVLRVK